MEEEGILKYIIKTIDEEDMNKLKNIVSSIPKDLVSEILSRPIKNIPTPLIQAIKRDNVPIVKFLLEDCHVDPMVTIETLRITAYTNTFYCELSPIHACCEKGNIETLKILVKRGVVHKLLQQGLNPLQSAALEAHEDIVAFYSDDENYYTREEVCDCIELLGVEFVRRNDLPSAIRFWNRALIERPRSDDTFYESSILGYFQEKSEQIKNYDHMLGDIEKSIIHSLIILEKVLGIENIQFYRYIVELAALMPITNTKFWEIVQSSTYEHLAYRLFHAYYYSFTNIFHRYIQNRYFTNINSSVFVVFHKYINYYIKTEIFTFDPEVLFDQHLPLRIGLFCICAIKNNVSEFDIKWLYVVIKIIINMTDIYRGHVHSFLCLFFGNQGWGFPDKINHEKFEICCKIIYPVTYLNHSNETPLFSALEYDESGEFIPILLKYGALTDTKNAFGITIRKQAERLGRISYFRFLLSSFQITINGKVIQDNNDHKDKDLPAILRSFMKMH